MVSVARALVDQLTALGLREAYGISGGAIAVLFDALLQSSIRLRHCRHESGAVFAATEAYFASGCPAMVFTTTGPGLLNALTGVYAARLEGAKLLLVSGHTNPAQRGRYATQETTSYTVPQDALYGRGVLFDLAMRLDDGDELLGFSQRLAAGFASPGRFIAHLALPMRVQSSTVQSRPVDPPRIAAPYPAPDIVEECASALRDQEMALWLGFGAQRSASRVRALVAKSGAHVFCSPRAKGVVSEHDPRFVGVTGIGGHPQVLHFMRDHKPRELLVLGTRLGEPTSFWDPDMLPRERIVHVDLDREVPGTAYPDFPSVGVHAEIGAFLEALLSTLLASDVQAKPSIHRGLPAETRALAPSPEGLVRPQVLMDALQRVFVDGSNATILAECGNAFAWCTHHLRFSHPGRYRVSTAAGSMGHATTGVVGAALATGHKAVAVVGDGSMLMFNEVGTAVEYDAPVVWVVLNDCGYGMCRDGHDALGLRRDGLSFRSRVDFVRWAEAMGARGERVTSEAQLEAALGRGRSAQAPYLVDVLIDPAQPSPLVERFSSLVRQGSRGDMPGWD